MNDALFLYMSRTKIVRSDVCFFKRSFTVAGSVAANAITPYVSKMARFASNIIFIVIILFIHGQDGHNLVSLANAVSHHLANDRRNNTFCRNYFSIVSDK